MSRVLVVDDDPTQLRILSTWLLSKGHEVVTAKSVSEAKEHLRQEAAKEAPTIHALILDLELGNGNARFNGLSLLKEVPPRIHQIVLSGYGPEQIRDTVNPFLNVQFYFAKPLLRSEAPKRDDFADLLHIIEVAGEARKS